MTESDGSGGSAHSPRDAVFEHGLGALQVEWAAALLEGLAEGGVTRWVISPGSRSTPLVLAAVAGGLELFSVVDERSAAFFALGLARGDGRPAGLVCTSGTAPAHYLPALLEAAEDHLPLVAISADRPSERQACGAPQTVDQVKLFGDAVVAFFDLPVAEAGSRSLRAVARLGAQAALSCRWPTPGPVHVNFRARRPLAPQEASWSRRAPAARRRGGPRIRPPQARVDPEVIAEVRARLREARRPLVVCGPAPLARASAREAISTALAAWRLPVFAELTSQLRPLRPGAAAGALEIPELGVALESERVQNVLEPDLIVQIGRPPVPTPWERFVETRSACRHLVLDERRVFDPVSSAELVALGPIADLVQAVGNDAEPRVDSDWLSLLRALAGACRRAIDETLAQPATEPFRGEGAIARAAVGAARGEGLLALGNSLALRLADTFASPEAPWRPVWCQRGANGIDGIVSGVAGSLEALRPGVGSCVLLLGDLALLHDLAGLARARELRLPWALVVLANRGGRIFEQLPAHAAALAAGAAERFTTPHDVALGPACAAFGVAHATAETPAELAAALEGTLAQSRATVIEVCVGPHAAAEERQRLRRQLVRRLASWGASPGAR